MLRRFALALVALIICAVSAGALSDVAGSGDHPLFRRPAGYRIVSYSRGNRSVTLALGNEIVALYGKQTDILYKTEGKPLSPAELNDRFTAALGKAGAEILSGENPLLGGRRVVGRLTRPGRNVWVMQDVLSLREYRLVVMETPNNLRSLSSIPVSHDIYETEAQVLDLLHLAERTGRLELPVTFVSGTNILQKGFEPGFQKIVMLMEKDPSLLFRVKAGADAGIKPIEARIQLRNRAIALVDELVRMGADPGRLTAATGNNEEPPVPSGVAHLVAVRSSDIQKQ